MHHACGHMHLLLQAMLAMCHICISLCMLCDTWLAMCHPTPVASKNIKLRLSRNSRLGNKISCDEPNDEVLFVIRDLENSQVFNLYRSGKFTMFAPFFGKAQIHPGFTKSQSHFSYIIKQVKKFIFLSSLFFSFLPFFLS